MLIVPAREGMVTREKGVSMSNLQTRVILFFLAIAVALQPAFSEDCEKLASLSFPHTTITSAEKVPAGGFTLPGRSGQFGPPPSFKELPAFCRVAATSKPTSDSEIKFEVWLPEGNAWNGRFQAVGGGGLAGGCGHGCPAPRGGRRTRSRRAAS